MAEPELKYHCERYNIKMSRSCFQYSKANPDLCRCCKHAAPPDEWDGKRFNPGRVFIIRRNNMDGVKRLFEKPERIELSKVAGNVSVDIKDKMDKIAEATGWDKSTVLESLLEEGLRVYEEAKKTKNQ
ncbi:MAG: hypothetical protein JW984_15150 [Deltaproteobacteria bacterium]|uniref:Uncharacterized protein n=1 Tax=Candidatus Zymogenus saltonus TaxID=2844893 RepID=A0A9D8PS23_9DELT|nr:hypothetical protein [Candidatus Zymogenus saltonus]